MKPINIDQLEQFTIDLLGGMGLARSDSAVVAEVYRRATLRGVGHHDIHDLPQRLKALDEGLVNPAAAITMTASYHAVENYDGDNGLGERCSSFIMDRAQQLAERYGIGCCSVHNSNHFLSAAPYVEKAAEAGYFAMIWTSSSPVMGWPGSREKLIGNNPMGFASPGKPSGPLFLDISMAYSSIGNLTAKAKANENIPSFWAVDSEGNPTDHPDEALRGAALPIGMHKGFGLALLGELLTSVMSGGTMIDQKAAPNQLFGHHMHSQTAIAMKPDAFMPMEQYRARVEQVEHFIKTKHDNIRLPGERSHMMKRELQQRGLYLDEALVEVLDQWAEKYGVKERLRMVKARGVQHAD